MDKVCPECGERMAAAILKSGLCYECDLKRRGRLPEENHHVIGRDVDTTAIIPANLHRALSHKQEQRMLILKGPSDDPLIQVARIVTIVAELFETGVEYVEAHDLPEWLAGLGTIAAELCRQAADQLLAIAHSLMTEHGADWWKGRILWPVADLIDVAERAFCSRQRAPTQVLKIARQTARRPSRFIAFDTETATGRTNSMPGFNGARWGGETQALLFGVARIGWTRRMKVVEEILFYPDDLPAYGIDQIREYVETNTVPLAGGERRWRDEPAIAVRVMPLSEFMKEFYRIAYVKRGLVIGFNLPFDFGRLAWNWGPSHSQYSAGGWSLTLWSYKDKETGEKRANSFRPHLTIKKAGPHKHFMRFTRTKDNQGNHDDWQGEFLDLGTLAFALTSSAYGLASACEKFSGYRLEKDVQHGVISPDYIDYARRDVKATVALAASLLARFDDHPVSRAKGGQLSETKSYSPASLAKAYLDTIGLRSPTMPDDRIGICMAAFHGGWSETRLRGRAPVAMLDFTKMYQTVFVLQRMQELLSSQELVFEEATAEIREFVDEITLDDMFKPETWPLLRAVCWVRPNGEALMTRAKYNEQTFTSGMVPRYSQRELPYYLADVILAKLLFGKASEIVRAERIVGKGRQQLRNIQLPGGRAFNPDTDDFFRMNVEETRRMKGLLADGTDGYRHMAPEIRATIADGLKCIGNSGAFGIFVEVNEQDLLGDEAETVALCGSQDCLSVKLKHPEEPGRFFCPAIGAAITAGARLMLGLAHCLVRDKKGIVAFGDTDSLAVIATRDGRRTKIRSSVGNQAGITSSRIDTVNTLSWEQIDEIARAFEALNPYDTDVITGSILTLTAENFADEQQSIRQELTALCIAPKRYCLTAGKKPIKPIETVLGSVMSPIEFGPADDRQPIPNEWIPKAWEAISRAFDYGSVTQGEFPWMDRPRVRQLAVTTPHVMKNLRALNRGKPRDAQIRPFNFFITATAWPNRTVVAPYENNPALWDSKEWILTETGGTVIPNRFITIEHLLRHYAEHASKEWLDSAGNLCGASSKGLMERRGVRDDHLYLTTKASLDLGDTPDTYWKEDQGQAFCVDPDDSDWHWKQVAVPALRTIGLKHVAAACNVELARAKEWLLGRNKPGDHTKAVAGRVARRALALGLDTSDERIDPMPAILLEAWAVRLHNIVVTSLMVQSLGGVRQSAKALGIARASLSDWLHVETAPESIDAINTHLVKLASHVRLKPAQRRKLQAKYTGLFLERAYLAKHTKEVTNPVPFPTKFAIGIFILLAFLIIACNNKECTQTMFYSAK